MIVLLFNESLLTQVAIIQDMNEAFLVSYPNLVYCGSNACSLITLELMLLNHSKGFNIDDCKLVVVLEDKEDLSISSAYCERGT